MVFFFFFQAEDGIRDVRTWLEFRRVLFRSSAVRSQRLGSTAEREVGAWWWRLGCWDWGTADWVSVCPSIWVSARQSVTPSERLITVVVTGFQLYVKDFRNIACHYAISVRYTCSYCLRLSIRLSSCLSADRWFSIPWQNADRYFSEAFGINVTKLVKDSKAVSLMYQTRPGVDIEALASNLPCRLPGEGQSTLKGFCFSNSIKHEVSSTNTWESWTKHISGSFGEFHWT